jgi:hypothetical protein
VTALEPHNARYLQSLRDLIAPGAMLEELALYAEVCRAIRLSPFGEQIALIGRHDKKAGRVVYRPQILIAGRRTIADRTGDLLGVEGPVWCGPRVDGELRWADVWTEDGANRPPYCARVLVHKRGWVNPANGTAKWSEFAQRDRDGHLTGLWQTMPSHMLGVRAESLALRRAFSAAIADAQDIIDDHYGAEAADDDPPAADPDVLEPPRPAVPYPPVVDLGRVDAGSARDLDRRARLLADVDPDRGAQLRGIWLERFAGRQAPRVDSGDYTPADARYFTDALERLEAAADLAPDAVYDDDPDAYEGGATRYDPDDGDAA